MDAPISDELQATTDRLAGLLIALAASDPPSPPAGLRSLRYWETRDGEVTHERHNPPPVKGRTRAGALPRSEWKRPAPPDDRKILAAARAKWLSKRKKSCEGPQAVRWEEKTPQPKREKYSWTMTIPEYCPAGHKLYFGPHGAKRGDTYAVCPGCSDSGRIFNLDEAASKPAEVVAEPEPACV